MKQWKLSPLDEKAPAHWEDYTIATIDTFRRTDSDHAPWWFVNNNAKRIGRINVIRHVLSLLPYDTKDPDVVRPPRPDIVAPARLRRDRDGSQEVKPVVTRRGAALVVVAVVLALVLMACRDDSNDVASAAKRRGHHECPVDQHDDRGADDHHDAAARARGRHHEADAGQPHHR